MSAPLYEHLRQYASEKRISFAMPGHKNGRGLTKNFISLDVTELKSTENLYHGGKFVTEANRLLSRLYGSDKSYILTGGSTAAIQAMICGAVKSGGTLLAGGDCHASVINACAILGINIRFFQKEIDTDFSVPGETNSIESFLTDDIDAVLISSPNYYGICSNVKRIAMECHSRNIPLLVDEAHGAHFVASGLLPVSAVQYADAVCHSAHKTLNALNGAAYLHLCGNRIDYSRIDAAITMFQSTSPSYVIASSADVARDEIENGGGWDKTINICKSFRQAAAQAGIGVLENSDITRIVLNFSDFMITGFEVSDILSESGIDIEMADLFNIVLIVTPSNTMEDLRSIWWVLLDIAERIPRRDVTINTLPPQICPETLSPAKAFWAESEVIDFEKSNGRISCETVVPYPPGIPIIFTGEKIRAEQVEYITRIKNAGGEINGAENGKIKVVR